MPDDQIARINRIANAYSVEAYEPGPEKKNSSAHKEVYVTPWKTYAFNTPEQVLAFLGERLDKLKPVNAEKEYADAFKAATKKGK